jgi:hypothetical protein
MVLTSYYKVDAFPYDHPLRWLVTSKSRPDTKHLVDLGEGVCTCEDHQFRNLRCKHVYWAEQALLNLTIATLKKSHEESIHPPVTE